MAFNNMVWFMPQRPELTWEVLTWEVCSPTGNLFPFSVKPSRYLFQDELSKVRELCETLFGSGGNKFPDADSLWAVNEKHNFSFKKETDQTIFMMSV